MHILSFVRAPPSPFYDSQSRATAKKYRKVIKREEKKFVLTSSPWLNFLTANEIYFICRGKTTNKSAKAISILDRKQFCTEAREKGLSVLQNLKWSGWTKISNFFAQVARPVVKNCILWFLANMKLLRDGICTGYINRRIHLSVQASKKDTK